MESGDGLPYWPGLEIDMFKRHFRVDLDKLEYLRVQRGWSVDRIQEEFEAILEREDAAPGRRARAGKLRGGKRNSKVTRGTVFNIGNGKPVLLETVRLLARIFDLDDVTLLLAEGEIPAVGPPESWGPAYGHFSALPDWEPGELLGILPGRPHGVGSELWQVEHRFIPGRRARGKLYLTDGLSTAERNGIREYLVRHADVCNRLAGHPWFPRNITSAPATNNQGWWVVDEWVDGETVAEALAERELDPRDAARVLKQLARALHALHENGIVRRDLSPEDILIIDGDGALILTDLELAKVLEGRPTVAPADWWEHENPLRAPEVGSPDLPRPGVDLYSWARLFVRLLAGEYPPPVPDPVQLDAMEIPANLRSWVASCLSVAPSKRPESFAPVLAALDKWNPR